ncbi:uncharacterized protein MONOS_17401 [Monocercomonoides exilis]|nr:hypothetical protein MONOS_17401 [Monocercomonoides exilis]
MIVFNASSGEIGIDGSEVVEKDESDAKRGVGFVPFKIIRMEKKEDADGDGELYRQEMREVNNANASSRGTGGSSSWQALLPSRGAREYSDFTAYVHIPDCFDREGERKSWQR